jgi:hypothetical protein
MFTINPHIAVHVNTVKKNEMIHFQVLFSDRKMFPVPAGSGWVITAGTTCRSILVLSLKPVAEASCGSPGVKSQSESKLVTVLNGDCPFIRLMD